MEALDHEGYFKGVVETEEERSHHQHFDDRLEKLRAHTSQLEENEDSAFSLEEVLDRADSNDKIEDDEEEKPEDRDQNERRDSYSQ